LRFLEQELVIITVKLLLQELVVAGGTLQPGWAKLSSMDTTRVLPPTLTTANWAFSPARSSS
jgi:hypothetical protein